MIIIGITGLIASGKTFVSDIFSARNIAVFNADKVVHQLYRDEIVIKAVKEIAANAVKNNQIDKAYLSNLAFNNDLVISKLESLLHPLVRERFSEFIALHQQNKTEIIILDIPLLFKAGLNEICQYIIYCKASEKIIKSRYLTRSNSSKEKLSAILAMQKKYLKEDMAHFTIDTEIDKLSIISEIEKIIKIVKNA